MSTEPVDPVIRAFLGVEHSASGQRWMSRTDQAGQNRALAISQLHGIPELVARVLAGRGVEAADAEAYLDPTIKNLMPDPSVLTDMGAAAVDGEPAALPQAVAAQALSKRPGRTEYQRGILSKGADGRCMVRTTGPQGSGVLSSMAEADCLIVLEHERAAVQAGETVSILPLQAFP